MVALSWPTKDPDEILDYQLDWSARILNDTIKSSVWEVPEGLTKRSDAFSVAVTTVWLAGGTDAQTYVVLNRIVTDGGRTMDQSVKLKIQDK
jgi:hypothetical protein